MTIGIDASLARIFKATPESRQALRYDPPSGAPEYQADSLLDSLLAAANAMVIVLVRPVKGLGA
jgi:hypothetical protein